MKPRTHRRPFGLSIRQEDGYSLVEILAAMALLSIILLAAIPQYNKHKERASVQQVMQDLRSAAIAMEAEVIHGGKYPDVLPESTLSKNVRLALYSSPSNPSGGGAATPPSGADTLLEDAQAKTGTQGDTGTRKTGLVALVGSTLTVTNPVDTTYSVKYVTQVGGFPTVQVKLLKADGSTHTAAAHGLIRYTCEDGYVSPYGSNINLHGAGTPVNTQVDSGRIDCDTRHGGTRAIDVVPPAALQSGWVTLAAGQVIPVLSVDAAPATPPAAGGGNSLDRGSYCINGSYDGVGSVAEYSITPRGIQRGFCS